MTVRLKSAQTERERTGYHEAGHAVVGLVFGLPVASVSVKKRGKKLGYCKLDESVPFGSLIGLDSSIKNPDDLQRLTWGVRVKLVPSRRKINLYLAYTLAGAMTEGRLTKNSHWPSQADSDWYNAKDVAGLLNVDELVLRSKVVRLANQTVEKHWDSIVAVARALEQDSTLSGDEVQAVMKAVRHRSRPKAKEAQPAT